MKKFMFSAIAMMAFSVGSMANTICLEESLPIEDNSNDCQIAGENVMGDLLDAGVSYTEAVWWGNVMIAFCEGYTWDQVRR